MRLATSRATIDARSELDESRGLAVNSGNVVAEVLRAYVNAGDSEDYAALRRYLAEDVVTHSPGGIVTEGVDAHVRSWVAGHEGLAMLRHEIKSVISAGVVAAARIFVTGVHNGRFLDLEPTGARVGVDQALFVRVEAGLIAEIWEVVDTGSALRQMGVLGDQPLAP